MLVQARRMSHALLILAALAGCSGGGSMNLPSNPLGSGAPSGANTSSAPATHSSGAHSPSSVIASPQGSPQLTAASSSANVLSTESLIPGLTTKLFSDDFESGSAPNWTIANGSFNVVHNAGQSAEFAATDTAENDAFAGNPAWTDYSVEAYVRPSSIDGSRRGVVIVAREQDANHFYQLELDREYDGSTQWEMWRHQGSDWISLAHGPIVFSADTQYCLRLAVVGSHLTASIARDYSYKFSTLGSADDTNYASGRIGLRAWGGMTATFDNVRVFGKSNGNVPTPVPSPVPSVTSGPTAVPTQTPPPPPNPTPLPTAIPTPTAAPTNGNVPKRMHTFIQRACLGGDTGCSGGPMYASPQQVASLVDYAQPDDTSPNTQSALRANGVKINLYFDFNKQYGNGDSLTRYNLPEDAFFHDCNGNRSVGGAGDYLIDIRSQSVLSAITQWSNDHGKGKFDSMYMDDMFQAVDTLGSAENVCNRPDRATWAAATRVAAAAIGMPTIFGQLVPLYPQQGDDPYVEAAYSYPSVIGANYENCYGNYDGTKVLDQQGGSPFWSDVESSEIQSSLLNRNWICLNGSRFDATSSSGIDIRQFYEASVLLTYNLNSTYVETPGFKTPNLLPVMPEVGLVALNPLVPTPSNISGLNNGGAYVREYGACYLAGVAKGRCAAIVNPSDSNTVSNPLQNYRSTLRMSGGNAYDGGTVDINGAAPPTAIAPQTGLVVFQ